VHCGDRTECLADLLELDDRVPVDAPRLLRMNTMAKREV